MDAFFSVILILCEKMYHYTLCDVCVCELGVSTCVRVCSGSKHRGQLESQHLVLS